MRIAIAGASGVVGQEIIPLLEQAGHELVLLGTEPDRLVKLYPMHQVSSYQHADQHLDGCDRFINLAACNNDSQKPYQHFQEVNVRFALDLLEMADKAGIEEYIYVSSVHVLSNSVPTRYSKSKQEGQQALENSSHSRNIRVLTIFLGAVLSPASRGKISLLFRTPRVFHPVLSAILASLKPTSKPQLISEYLGDPELFQRERPLGDDGIVATDRQMHNRVYNAATRIIDLVGAAIIVLIGWWLFIVLWIMIRLDSKGGAIFAQERIGQNGKAFICYKFRTMVSDTKNVATHELDRSSVTKLGGTLRRIKFDELPQIINIFKGEMSFVGPRPCLPNQVALINARKARNVLSIRPGITGLAQVNDIDMSNPHRLAIWDARYLSLRSLLLDGKIVLQTLFGGGRGDRIS